jgi:hypothetical protein
MVASGLPPVVAGFLTTHIRDLDDLQLLITLVNAADRWWDTRSIARGLHIPENAARAALEHLAGRNLLEIRLTGDVRYEFHPGNEELRERRFCSGALSVSGAGGQERAGLGGPTQRL